MRVVLDTSVLAQVVASRRGLIGLKKLTQQGLLLVSSAYIINELERTLNQRFQTTKQQARARTRAFAKISKLVVVEHVLNLSRDPNDDPVIAAAVAGQADFLVTADNDLLELRKVNSTRIITYNAFQQKLAKLLQ